MTIFLIFRLLFLFWAAQPRHWDRSTALDADLKNNLSSVSPVEWPGRMIYRKVSLIVAAVIPASGIMDKIVLNRSLSMMPDILISIIFDL
ncbi:hypothetical protein [Desulfobacter vibrioformis]|uniref:hypothetical protein n=1 Tax=Desulfobacter vibrioformis TaxID=34031 RepID=UPI000A0446F1|nr:hypothetical protein [Desulfobacter vibrioformis]